MDLTLTTFAMTLRLMRYKMDIENYQCESCGATNSSKPYECCDDCILKFFFGDVNANPLGEENF